MKKYISVSLISFMVLAIVYIFPVYSYAGNQNNASNAGNVTAVILCENEDEGTEELEVDHSQLTIVADGCSCTLQNFVISAADCAGSDCTACLAESQMAGMTINATTSFLDGDGDSEKMQFLLTGNAGPFLIRNGECPCS